MANYIAVAVGYKVAVNAYTEELVEVIARNCRLTTQEARDCLDNTGYVASRFATYYKVAVFKQPSKASSQTLMLIETSHRGILHDVLRHEAQQYAATEFTPPALMPDGNWVTLAYCTGLAHSAAP